MNQFVLVPAPVPSPAFQSSNAIVASRLRNRHVGASQLMVLQRYILGMRLHLTPPRRRRSNDSSSRLGFHDLCICSLIHYARTTATLMSYCLFMLAGSGKEKQTQRHTETHRHTERHRHTGAWTHRNTYTWTHAHARTHRDTRAHAHTHGHAHTRTRTRTNTHTHTKAQKHKSTHLI